MAYRGSWAFGPSRCVVCGYFRRLLNACHASAGTLSVPPSRLVVSLTGRAALMHPFTGHADPRIPVNSQHRATRHAVRGYRVVERSAKIRRLVRVRPLDRIERAFDRFRLMVGVEVRSGAISLNAQSAYLASSAARIVSRRSYALAVSPGRDTSQSSDADSDGYVMIASGWAARYCPNHVSSAVGGTSGTASTAGAVVDGGIRNW